mmetsp:Transcript_21061/g.34851  ORF Transcript_21061/g.34851 Transcript_21061/m.34851 type:complete len:232 (+) Transcript_21061:42-737(+)|eukprot:CAMPEP_0119007266 /NCGR_PEP_ID=MMETSP1176-20130426/2898_1 /TAXON_ID=265551 /ORGANISM="Synedropsis recta cf, Strain CCMP1620" /LENGTH=231 /DNA_ID=CAMNT_0006959381 /DNA_START=22 /DNA_END=717 /DNA_ORIENTATION=-
MDLASKLNEHASTLSRHFCQNIWLVLLCMLFAGLSVRTNLLGALLQENQDTLNVDPEQEFQLEERIKRIRLQQQQDVTKRSIAAGKIRKEKEREDKKKKSEAAIHQKLKGGHILGGGSDSGGPTSRKADEERRRNRPRPQQRNIRNNQPLPWGRGNTHTIDEVTQPQTNSWQQQGAGSTGSQAGSNWNTQGTHFMSPDDRWAQAERGARMRRSGGPPAPGNAPSSRGNWGR